MQTSVVRSSRQEFRLAWLASAEFEGVQPFPANLHLLEFKLGDLLNRPASPLLLLSCAHRKVVSRKTAQNYMAAALGDTMVPSFHLPLATTPYIALR